MKLTERQALALFTIAQDSLRSNILGVFSVDIKSRHLLVNSILNQQDNKIIVAHIKEEDKRKEKKND